MLRTVMIASMMLLAACSGQPQQPQLDDLSNDALDVVWREKLGKGSGSLYSRMTMVTEGDQLFMADARGTVYQLSLESGDEVWSVDMGQPVTAGVAVRDSRIYLVTLDGQLHALDRNNGKSLWQASLSSEAVATPSSDGERVYVHTVDGRISAFEESSGRQLWSYESLMPVLTVRGTGSPLSTDGMVITGVANGKVIALDARLGVPRWEVRLAVPDGRSELERLVDVDGTVTADGRYIYAASYHGKTAAIGLDGQTSWEEDGSSYTSPVLGLGNSYLSLDDGTIQAYDQLKGTRVWTQSSLEGRKISQLVAIGNQLAVTDSDGWLYLINQVDGSMAARRLLRSRALHVSFPNQTEATAWRRLRHADFGVRNPMLSTERGLLVYTNNGELLLIDTTNE